MPRNPRYRRWVFTVQLRNVDVDEGGNDDQEGSRRGGVDAGEGGRDQDVGGEEPGRGEDGGRIHEDDQQFCKPEYWEGIYLWTDSVSWLVVGGPELAPSTRQRHLHGCIGFDRPVNAARVQGLLRCGERGVWTSRMEASPGDAAAYACKEGIIVSLGDAPGRSMGTRSDFERAKGHLEEGKTPAWFDEEMPAFSARYHRWIRRRFAAEQRKRQRVYRELDVRCYWGASRTGKSRDAFREAGDSVYIFPIQRSGNCWLQRYEGEDAIIFDDFNAEINIEVFLKLLDGQPCTAELKGGECYPRWTKVWITSNKPPHEWYEIAHPDHQEALLNRIHTIKHYEKQQ